MEPKARICWRIRGREGKGSPIPWRAAQDSVEALNRQYGAGTHWIEIVGSASTETVADQVFSMGCTVSPSRFACSVCDDPKGGVDE